MASNQKMDNALNAPTSSIQTRSQSKRNPKNLGFKEMTQEDQKLVSSEMKTIMNQENLLERYQNDLKDLSCSFLIYLLKFNGQEAVRGRGQKIKLLSDVMAFGSLEMCEECGGQLMYFKGKNAYQCLGNISPWTKCHKKVEKPKRRPFKIPPGLRKKFPFLAQYEARVDDRVLLSAEKGSRQVRRKRRKTSMSAKKAVDPSKIYTDKDGHYSSVLSLTDVRTGRNSFYKMCIIVDKNSYFLKRSWGKIGRGHSREISERIPDVESAKKKFENIFYKKTGNKWIDKANWVKKPNLMFPIDVKFKKIEKFDPVSDVPLPISELLSIIFNVDIMIHVMTVNQLDTTRMPLGTLSRQQILKAFEVLSELKNEKRYLIDRYAVDASNQFYTLIPHDFYGRPPPILNSETIIESKSNILMELLEIERTYRVMSQKKMKSLHTSYQIFDCMINVLDKNSNEYKMIKCYAFNSNSSLHGFRELQIIDIFQLKRKGEEEKYNKKYKNMINKVLLWHGSRVTNIAGILSEGLRIAPPEVPSTGYMFGKGIYFSDIISKSANYCLNDYEGFVFLCEVALGNMYEKRTSEYITSLPPGMNSTMGVGMIHPSMVGSKVINDVFIPCAPLTTRNIETSLYHNEYVIYDVDQVKLKYLLRLRLKK